jgi:ABC-2 type transport system permease protein
MITFLASLRKELLEQWRTSRMLISVVVLLFFGMTSPLLAKFMPQIIGALAPEIASVIPAPTFTDAIAQYVKNISQFMILLAIFIPMGAVAQEKERGTAVLMLVKPLSRGTFLITKFLALGVTFLVGIVLAGIAAYYYTMFLFQAPDIKAWLALNLLLWLYGMVFVALTLFGSTLFKSQAAAAGIGFGGLLLLGILGSIPKLGEYLPGQLVNWGARLFGKSGASNFPALWVSLGIILVCLVAGWLVFREQEL